ncbi:unnamed protein product, partial [Nesidiocoris tenuis]
MFVARETPDRSCRIGAGRATQQRIRNDTICAFYAQPYLPHGPWAGETRRGEAHRLQEKRHGS